MDTAKMRACAPLLPAPGDEVVVECLAEIDRLQARAAYLDEQRTRLAIAIDDSTVLIDRLRAENEALRQWLDRCHAALHDGPGLTVGESHKVAQLLQPNAELSGAGSGAATEPGRPPASD